MFVRHLVDGKVTNLSEAHVLFDGVDASLEVGSGGVHVGDHRADVTDDGGKDQHAHLEASGRERHTHRNVIKVEEPPDDWLQPPAGWLQPPADSLQLHVRTVKITEFHTLIKLSPPSGISNFVT